MDSHVASARRAIAALLRHGPPHIEGAATYLGWSVRTLQRRLAEDGVSYSNLVDEVRFAEARRRLRAHETRIGHLAVELGYRDAGSFTRAFRRWAGTAPRSYRRRHARVARD